MINYNKLSKAAKEGRFSTRLKIETQSDVDKLEYDGFILNKSTKSMKGSKIYNVSWGHAVVDSDNIESLNENLYIYTLPEKLWIIAQKANLHY